MAKTSNKSLSEATPKKIPNHFIQALYSLIESQQYSHLINWSENGESITINQPHLFAELLLPNLCKHSNLSSFIRQLNMYCFKKCKTRQSNDAISYSNPFFVKGRPELLKNIIRKNPRQMLKQKEETELKQFEIESRSSNSYTSGEPKYEELTRKMIKNTKIWEDNRLQADSSDDIMSSMDQIIDKMTSKVYKTEMAMIQEYLNDDEDNYQEDIQLASEKLKNSWEFSGEEDDNQYVQMDFNTLNFKLFSSNQSKESLNSQSPISIQVFNGKDFMKCQNLIKNLFKVNNKIAGYSHDDSDSTQSYLQELGSCGTRDMIDEF